MILKTITRLLFVGLIVATSSQSFAQAAQPDLMARLKHRNDLFLTTVEVYPFLFDDTVKDRLGHWLVHPKNNSYLIDCQMKLRPFFQSANVIGPVCYLLRQNNPERRQFVFRIIKRYRQEMISSLIDISSDPRMSADYRSKANSYLTMFMRDDDAAIKQCFQKALQTQYPDSGEISFTPFQETASCLNQNLPKIAGKAYVGMDLPVEFAPYPGHAVSDLGWIDGNEVKYLDWNDTSREMTDFIITQLGIMEKTYPLTGAGSLESFKQKDASQVFTPQEGFPDINAHKIWNQDRGIFKGIKDAIAGAKETLFIDVFFLGGTMGGTVAKYIVQRIKENPNLKVFILRDNYNHFGHEGEMRPVYNFLLSQSYKFPGQLVVASSYIKGHRSGLPKVFARLIDDQFLVQSGIQKHLSLYGKAMSDHSKVIAVDVRSSSPIAIVGSKNLTDASGAICYDEVAVIKGPAAAALMDDYYFDMAMSLKLEMPKDYVQMIAANGWSKSLYSSGQSIEQMTANILKPFDLLDRNASGVAQRQGSIDVPRAGSIPVRIGGNNVNSSRTNAVDQDVQLIKGAKRTIYIKDQYLFDKPVVLALIDAKQKNPSLEIKAILEPMHRANPKGMPNLLYLDVLKQAGVEIKWKKVADTDKIAQEYHMKTISADGKNVITGSANKDQTTMYGAFRESQVEIFDSVSAKIHDDRFLEQWNSGEESEAFNGYDFTVPGGLKGLDGKPMTPTQFMALVRNVIAIMFDAQTY